MAIPPRSACRGTPWLIAVPAVLAAVSCQSTPLQIPNAAVPGPAVVQIGGATAPSFPPPSGSASDRVAVSLPSPLTAEEAARKAASAERKGDTACVDLYAWAALQCWPTLHTPGVAEKKREQAWKLYHDSLEKLITNGLKFQRLDPQRGFDVQTPSGTGGRIAIARNGFAWREEDFNEIQLVPDLNRKTLKHYFQEPGLGVPLIVTRRRPEGRDFLGPVMPFAATAVLRPAAPRGLEVADGPAGRYAPPLSPGDVIGVFDLYDPLHLTQVSFGAASQNLARDISAPWRSLPRKSNARIGSSCSGRGSRTPPGASACWNPTSAAKSPSFLCTAWPPTGSPGSR